MWVGNPHDSPPYSKSLATPLRIYTYIVSSIHAYANPKGDKERTATNLMHFKWEVTWTHGNQIHFKAYE